MELCILIHFFPKKSYGRNPILFQSHSLPCFFHKRKKVCPVPATAVIIFLSFYIRQNISRRRPTACKLLPFGGKPLLITSTKYLTGIGVSHLQIFHVGKPFFYLQGNSSFLFDNFVYLSALFPASFLSSSSTICISQHPLFLGCFRGAGSSSKDIPQLHPPPLNTLFQKLFFSDMIKFSFRYYSTKLNT